MRQINILYIITGLEIGGAERLLISVIRNLNREKYKIVVCFLKGKGPLANEIRGMGVKVVDMKMRGGFDLLVILKLVRLIKRENIDLVHTHLAHADIYGFISAKLARVPIIISTKHNIEDFRKRRSLFVLFDRWAANLSDKVIAVSDAVKAFSIKYEGIRPDKFITIHNGIEVGEFTKPVNIGQVKAEFVIDSQPVVGIVARLYPQKGHRYFLEAASQVLKVIPGVVFLITGDGPLKNELKYLALELGVSQNVIFTGWQEDISRIFAIMNVFVLPSVFDGFGIAILEAQARGRPVVVTDVGGFPEVVKDGETGILVPPQNPKRLARAIMTLLLNKKRAQRFGLAGRSRVEQYFTLEKMVKKIEDLYNQLINNKIKETTQFLP